MACCVLHTVAPGLSFSPVEQQLFALDQHQRMLSMLSTGLQWSNGSQVRRPGKSKLSPALPFLPVRWPGNPLLAAYSRRTRVMWISRVISRQRAPGHSQYKQVRRDLSSSFCSTLPQQQKDIHGHPLYGLNSMSTARSLRVHCRPAAVRHPTGVLPVF